MKLSKIALNITCASAVMFSIEARGQEPSAFDAFKTFCIDTDIKKEAISAKARSVGAVPVKLPETEVANLIVGIANIREDKAAWLVKLDSRQFRVHFSAMSLPAAAGQRAVRSDSCELYFEDEDARANGDLIHWAGLSDSETVKQPGTGSMSFEFRIIDGKHTPLPNGWRVDPNFSKTTIWMAEVSHWPSLSLSLVRKKPF
jgi:hypothetical protein